MANPQYMDDSVYWIYAVHNAVVAHTNAPVILVAMKLLRSHWSGIVGQGQDLGVYSREQGIIQSVQFLLGGRLDLDRKPSHAAGRVLVCWPGIPHKERFFPYFVAPLQARPECPPRAPCAS